MEAIKAGPHTTRKQRRVRWTSAHNRVEGSEMAILYTKAAAEKPVTQSVNEGEAGIRVQKHHGGKD